MSEYIEVGWYIGGVYHGLRQISTNSICGHFFHGDVVGAMEKLTELCTVLNDIPGVVSTTSNNNKSLNTDPESGAEKSAV